jgi:hypothetical protein
LLTFFPEKLQTIVTSFNDGLSDGMYFNENSFQKQNLEQSQDRA